MTPLNSRRMPADPGYAPDAKGSEASRLSNIGIGVLLLGVLMPQIDYFVVNVALATIRRSLDASPAVLELIVAGYGTAYATLLVIGGPARRPVRPPPGFPPPPPRCPAPSPAPPAPPPRG